MRSKAVTILIFKVQVYSLKNAYSDLPSNGTWKKYWARLDSDRSKDTLVLSFFESDKRSRPKQAFTLDEANYIRRRFFWFNFFFEILILLLSKILNKEFLTHSSQKTPYSQFIKNQTKIITRGLRFVVMLCGLLSSTVKSIVNKSLSCLQRKRFGFFLKFLINFENFILAVILSTK